MDDMTPELRTIVEIARAPSLTRADRARMWRRLEASLDDSARPMSRDNLRRSGFVPAFARHAVSAVCLLALALGVDPREATVVQPALPMVSARALDASERPPAARSPGLNEIAPQSKGSTTERHAAVLRPTSRRATSLPAKAAVNAGSEPSAEPLAALELEEGLAEDPVRVQPARAHILTAKPVGSGVQGRRSAPAHVSEEFREKLVAENLARYQAAIAQNARIASIKRPLPSVSGYGAW